MLLCYLEKSLIGEVNIHKLCILESLEFMLLVGVHNASPCSKNRLVGAMLNAIKDAMKLSLMPVGFRGDSRI